MKIKLLTVDDIIELHDNILQQYGGLHGIHDISLLNSSVERPYTQFADVELFKTIEEKISSVVHSIISCHVFKDGNKRTGIQVLLISLLINNIIIEYTQKEIVDLALNIATGNYNVNEISNWICNHRQ